MPPGNTMKLMHVIIGLEASGAELFLQRLVSRQVADNHHVIVISLTTEGKLTASLRALGVTVIALGLEGIWSIPKVLWLLRRLVIDRQPDIVQSWMYHADLLCGLALTGLKQKLIWSVRCSHVPAGSRLTYGIMKLCAYLSRFVPDKICYVAEAARINHQEYGYRCDKGVTIPNGYDFSTITFSYEKRLYFRSLLEVDDAIMLFGVVGRFHPDKGQDLLLQALGAMQHSLADFRLVLIGRDCSPDNQCLTGLLKKFDLEQKVILVGEQQDISGWLSALDVYVMPSRTEGFPNALAEAMAVGLPCISTQVGDAAILADKHALLCKPEIGSISSAIQHLVIWSAEKKGQVGRGAAVWVREAFSIDEIERKYYQLYVKLLES